MTGHLDMDSFVFSNFSKLDMIHVTVQMNPNKMFPVPAPASVHKEQTSNSHANVSNSHAEYGLDFLYTRGE